MPNITSIPARTALITVTHPVTPAGMRVTRSCGTEFRYIRSMERPWFAVMIECMCTAGHGVSHLPVRYWLTRKDATLDARFDQIPARAEVLIPVLNVPSPADIDIIPIDVLETLDVNQVVAVAATYRQIAANIAASVAA